MARPWDIPLPARRVRQRLALRLTELTNVKIRSCLSVKPRAVQEADPAGDHVFGFSEHVSGYDRKKHDAGLCGYIPVNLCEIPD